MKQLTSHASIKDTASLPEVKLTLKVTDALSVETSWAAHLVDEKTFVSVVSSTFSLKRVDFIDDGFSPEDESNGTKIKGYQYTLQKRN